MKLNTYWSLKHSVSVVYVKNSPVNETLHTNATIHFTTLFRSVEAALRKSSRSLRVRSRFIWIKSIPSASCHALGLTGLWVMSRYDDSRGLRGRLGWTDPSPSDGLLLPASWCWWWWCCGFFWPRSKKNWEAGSSCSTHRFNREWQNSNLCSRVSTQEFFPPKYSALSGQGEQLNIRVGHRSAGVLAWKVKVYYLHTQVYIPEKNCILSVMLETNTHLSSSCRWKRLLLFTLLHWFPIRILGDILRLFDQRCCVYTFHRDNIERVQVLKESTRATFLSVHLPTQPCNSNTKNFRVNESKYRNTWPTFFFPGLLTVASAMNLLACCAFSWRTIWFLCDSMNRKYMNRKSFNMIKKRKGGGNQSIKSGGYN